MYGWVPSLLTWNYHTIVNWWSLALSQLLSRVWLFAALWTVARRLLCPWDFPGKSNCLYPNWKCFWCETNYPTEQEKKKYNDRKSSLHIKYTNLKKISYNQILKWIYLSWKYSTNMINLNIFSFICDIETFLYAKSSVYPWYVPDVKS